MIKNEFKVASDPDTSIDILEKLSVHKDEHIRSAVASNENTTADILLKLAEDESSYVRSNVALNKKFNQKKLNKYYDNFSAEGKK